MYYYWKLQTPYSSIPDKADRKRNRVQSDEEDYNPDQESKRRRKGAQDSSEDEDSEYEESEGSKVTYD